MMDASFEMLAAAERGNVVRMMEFPEDSGKAARGWPASPWQDARFRELRGVKTWAFTQDQFGLHTPKPTRVITDCREIPEWARQGWPQISDKGRYQGPLPPPERGGGTLERQDGDPGFRTTGTAAYPPAMCEALAEVIIRELKARASEGGEWGPG